MMHNLHRIMLDRKPHIKEYYRLRKLHSEIVDAMAQYDADGKFVREIQTVEAVLASDSLPLQQVAGEFDLDERHGAQAYYDMLIYKPAPNMNCITEDFIQKHRYRRADKVDLLHSMLNSKLGLYEITGVDSGEGYVYLQDVFTKEQLTVTDVALSGTVNYSANYLYTRIVCCDGVCFNTGLSLVFSKSDPFIKEHIRSHRKNFNPNAEFLRFNQLYNRYSKSKDRVKVMTNPF